MRTTISKNYIYFDGVIGRYVRVIKNRYGDMNIAELQVFNDVRLCSGCSLAGDCQEVGRCNQDGSCPTESTFLANGTACNSKLWGTCQNGQCIEPATPAPTDEPTKSPFTATPTMYNPADRSNLALGNFATASQSTTCFGGSANRAIDGNTNGNWYANSVQHTCLEDNPWFSVDLGENVQHIINHVKVYNRNDCCMDRLVNSEVQILNDEGIVIDSQPIVGVSSEYTFDFNNVPGRYVRVYKSVHGDIQIAEVQAYGWQLTKAPTLTPSLSPSTLAPTLKPTISKIPTYAPSGSPTFAPADTSSPTRALMNLALVSGASAQQSSEYEGHGANIAIDGEKTNGANSVGHTHTQCSDSPSPWWRVYIGEGEIMTVNVYNRNDCCWGRLKDFTVTVLDENMQVVASRFYPGTGDRYDAVSLDFSDDAPVGQYVEVKLGSPDCLSLTEVEVLGYQIAPPASNLARGADAVASQSTTCWNGAASRAIDGNTNGQWGGNSVTHTCGEGSPYWMVDLGANKQYKIQSVSIYNRSDCCMDRNDNSDIQILDESGTVVVATMSIAAGDVKSVYNLNFGSVQGRYVRVQKKSSGTLNIAEVEVIGY
mmetsp:Transcript_21333/g.42799  ORF Transcript_21333/g.42799 Transcript_21333/m.42799 type:complete len:596 (-) Transcript_21333:491-2278(-)